VASRTVILRRGNIMSFDLLPAAYVRRDMETLCGYLTGAIRAVCRKRYRNRTKSRIPKMPSEPFMHGVYEY